MKNICVTNLYSKDCLGATMNNLQLFRSVCRQFLPSEKIQSYQEFKDLVNELCDKRLLHPREVKVLISSASSALNDKNLMGDSITEQTSSKKITFPLTFSELETLIMTQFGDSNCKELILSLKSYNKMLREIKGTLNIWKDKGLSLEERKELEAIFAKGNEEIKGLCEDLRRKKKVLESVNEQEVQMIADLDEWVEMQGVERQFANFRDFQAKNKAVISSLFKKNQVKEANFKKDLLSKLGNSKTILRATGFNPNNDEPVEVTLVSKVSVDFVAVNQELTKFEALRELSLSEYFPRFLGHNVSSNPTYMQYFSEHTEGVCLKEILSQTTQPRSTNPLLKYWMYSVYRALYDIFLMCSYKPVLPLSLRSFVVSNMGLRVVLKKAAFSQKRNEALKKNSQEGSQRELDSLQSDLLYNLGLIFLEILNLRPNELSESGSKLSFEERCLFEGLLNVRDSHKNFKLGVVGRYLSFFNLQTHPLLQDHQYENGSDIIECFCNQFAV